MLPCAGTLDLRVRRIRTVSTGRTLYAQKPISAWSRQSAPAARNSKPTLANKKPRFSTTSHQRQSNLARDYSIQRRSSRQLPVVPASHTDGFEETTIIMGVAKRTRKFAAARDISRYLQLALHRHDVLTPGIGQAHDRSAGRPPQGGGREDGGAGAEEEEGRGRPRSVCVSVSRLTLYAVLLLTMLQPPDAVIHVLPAQHSLGSCAYMFLEFVARRYADLRPQQPYQVLVVCSSWRQADLCSF